MAYLTVQLFAFASNFFKARKYCSPASWFNGSPGLKKGGFTHYARYSHNSMCIMPFSASIILVRVFEGVHPLAPVLASTFPTKSGLIKSKHIFNFPGGIDESMLGCHIKVTA